MVRLAAVVIVGLGGSGIITRSEQVSGVMYVIFGGLEIDGRMVGFVIGCFDGFFDGFIVEFRYESFVGFLDGDLVGFLDGFNVRLVLGRLEGDRVNFPLIIVLQNFPLETVPSVGLRYRTFTVFVDGFSSTSDSVRLL